MWLKARVDEESEFRGAVLSGRGEKALVWLKARERKERARCSPGRTGVESAPVAEGQREEESEGQSCKDVC